MLEPRRLSLEALDWSGPQLSMRFSIGGHPIGVSIWYADVDLDRLEAAIGAEPMANVAFHIAAFEINKLASLGATHLDFGAWSRFVTPRFVDVWRRVLRNVWAQWRWENDLPDWDGPILLASGRGETAAPPRAVFPNEPKSDVLLFVGGGKDSLVAAHLLDEAGVSWASNTYAHSVYGPPDRQHALIDRLLDAMPPVRRHRQWVSDDAFAAPLPALVDAGGARSFLAAETPSSIFGALPIALAHGYRTMALAHEHSANRGNLVWKKTGEDVNHQWGKSWEAENLLASYIEEELVPGFRWFSVLQPLSDVLIFELLRARPRATLATHSCNVEKPWCHRCAKCAYVALGYAAHLDDGIYERVFREDVLDLPENEIFFRQMIGLSDHTPFECIGEIDEARLALALVLARGRKNRATELFRGEGGTLDLGAVLSRYARVHADAPHGIPRELAGRVLPIMARAEANADKRIRDTLRAR